MGSFRRTGKRKGISIRRGRRRAFDIKPPSGTEAMAVKPDSKGAFYGKAAASQGDFNYVCDFLFCFRGIAGWLFDETELFSGRRAD